MQYKTEILKPKDIANLKNNETTILNKHKFRFIALLHH